MAQDHNNMKLGNGNEGGVFAAFRGWFEKRKDHLNQLKNEAARMITNKMAENENAFIAKLDGISFSDSKLPKEVLERKLNPKQPYGDLQFAAKALAAHLRKNPQVFKVDIREFDEKLMTLVLLFEQAVKNGDERAAYAAKGGVYRAIMEIRSRVPQNQPKLAKQFVKVNARYLDEWITLVSLAQSADRYKENADRQRKRYEDDIKNHKEKTEKHRQEMLQNPEKLEIFNKIIKRENSTNFSKWPKEEQEMYKDLLERRMDRVHTELNSALLLQSERDLIVTVGRVEILYTKVASLEIVEDPNLIEKYEESVNLIFKKLEESDRKLNDALAFTEIVEGKLKQLETAPGAVRAREMVAEEAEMLHKEILKSQEVKSSLNKVEAAKLRSELGFLDDDQLEKARKIAEAAEQKELERLRKELEEQIAETIENTQTQDETQTQTEDQTEGQRNTN